MASYYKLKYEGDAEGSLVPMFSVWKKKGFFKRWKRIHYWHDQASAYALIGLDAEENTIYISEKHSRRI